MAKELWVEKYRPKTVSEYVFRDESQRRQVQNWLDDGGIPHLLFSGSAGTGKTTLAKVLLNELGVEKGDILFTNGSKDGRKIDWLRDKLEAFCQTMPWGDFKVVLIDEADYLNPNSVQPALRNLMEEYSASVRFILTCNYPNKIIPPLHSRCQGFHIQEQDVTEFTARIAEICIAEGVEFDLDTLDNIVRANYPDLRKSINTVQQNVVDGKLLQTVEEGTSVEWRVKMVELFKAGKLTEARKLIVSSARADEYEEIYTWLYKNLDLFTSNDDQYDECVLAIRNGLVKHTQVADVEINLSATMVEIARAIR